MKQLGLKWWQILRFFYLKEANSVSSQHERKIGTGVFLLMFENFFLVICSLLRHEDTKLKALDTNLYYAIDQAKSRLYMTSSQLNTLVTVILGMNIAIIGIILALVYFQHQKQKNKQLVSYQEQSSFKKKGKHFPNGSHTKPILVFLMRQISCYYKSVIFPIGIFVSFLRISDLRGPIVLLLTLLLGVGMTDCEFSYIHQSKDFLAKPYHSSRFVVLVFQAFAILSFVHFDETTFLIILWVYFLIKIIAEIIIAPYWKPKANCLNCWVLLASLGGITIFFLGFHVFNTDEISISLLLIVIDLPFSAVLSWIFMRFEEYRKDIEFQDLVKKEESSINLGAENCGFEKLDRLVRNNLFRMGDSLQQQENRAIYLLSGLSFEWLNSNQERDLDVFDMNQVRLELINKIGKKFEAEIKSRDQKEHFHYYLSFLLSVQCNYRLFWLTTQKCKRNPGISLKNKQLINSISHHFKTYKSELEERIQRIALQQKDTAQLSNDGSLVLSLNPFYQGFLKVLDFEEHINLSYSLIGQATKLKLDLLELMKARYINSSQLSEQINVLEDNLTKIRQHILRAYLINPRSAQVADLQVIFMKSLAFTTDEKVLQRARHFDGSVKFEEELSQYNGDFKMFSRNQGVVFALLEDSFELKAIQVSVNFKRLFHCEPRDIINQQITRLMPGKLSSVHHSYVKSYLTQTDTQRIMEKHKNVVDSKDKQANIPEDFLMRMKDKLIFAVLKNDRSGFIISPIQVDAKMNTLNKSQLGFSARLRVFNNGSDYILFSANNLQTLGVTQNLFAALDNTNSEFCSSTEKFNLKQLFPFLISIQDSNLTGQDTAKQWKELNKMRFLTQFTCYIVLFKKTINFHQKDQRNNLTQAKTCFKNECALPVTKLGIQSNLQRYSTNETNTQAVSSLLHNNNDCEAHIIHSTNDHELYLVSSTHNLISSQMQSTQMQNSNSAERFKGAENSNALAVKKENQSIPQIHSLPHDESSTSTYRGNHQNNELQPQYFQNTQQQASQSNSPSCTIFQVDIQLVELNYSHLADIFAIQISRIRQLKQGESQQEVQNHVQQYFSTYAQFYQQHQLQLFLGGNSSQQSLHGLDKDENVPQKKAFGTQISLLPTSCEELTNCLDQQGLGLEPIQSSNNMNNYLGYASMQSHDNLSNIAEEKSEIKNKNEFNNSGDVIRRDLLNNSLNNLSNTPSYIRSPMTPSSCMHDKSHQQLMMMSDNFEQQSTRTQNLLLVSGPSPVELKKQENFWLSTNKKPLAGSAGYIHKRDIHQNNSAENLFVSQASKRSTSNLLKKKGSLQTKNHSKLAMFSSSSHGLNNEDTHEILPQFTTSPATTQRMFGNNKTIEEEEPEQLQDKYISQNQNQQNFKGRTPNLAKKHVSIGSDKNLPGLDSQINNNSFSDSQNQHKLDEDNNDNNIFQPNFDLESDDEDILGQKQRNERDLHAEIESHRSKASSTASLSQLKNYVKLLSGKEKSQAILVINYIGYLCYIVMAGLTVLTYVDVDSQLKSSFYDNSYSIWPMRYSWIMFNIFTNQNVQILVNQGDINTAGSLPTPASKLAYVTQTQSEAPKILETWKMLVAESFRVGTTRGVFQYFINETNVFQFQQLYNKTFIVGTNSVQTGFPVLLYNDTVLNSGAYMMPMLTRYITGIVENSEYYVITNSMNIVAALKLILNDIQYQYDYSNNFIGSNLIELMVVVIVISFFCLILLIPLYTFIQYRRDRIIELFCSFSLIEIETMTQIIFQSLLNSRNMMKTIKTLPQVTKKMADPKRQPLGNTSPLPKLNLPLIIIAIVAYALILTGPILNHIFTSKYIEETKYLYSNKGKQELTILLKYFKIFYLFHGFMFSFVVGLSGKIYELKAHSSNIMQINYQCLILKIRPSSKLVPLSLMMAKAISKNGLIQYYTDFLAAVIQDQENLVNVHEDFRNFFFAAIEHNICKAFTDYPQYTTSKMKTLLPTCTTLKQGILQQGFSISMRTFYAIFPTFNLFYATPTANIPTFLSQINSVLDLKEFTDFNQFLEEVIESLGNFIVIQYQNKFDFIRNLQFVIMIYQLIIMSLVFLAGWAKFASHLNKQFANTQQQLRVLNINALVENSYVIAYFKKHHRS